jgi:predicted N-acetyltransferase YhbS
VHAECDSGGAPEAPIDEQALRMFLDREFDGVPGVAREFPLLVGADNRHRQVVLMHGSDIAAHAAWRPMTLYSAYTPLRRIAAAGIGLVTTAAALRGRGLATRAVERCLSQARDSGAKLALLFGQPSELYRRLGFVRAGRERVTWLEPGPHDGAARVRVRTGGPGWGARLAPLLARHALRVERSAAEFEQLLAIPDTHLYVLEGARREPLAYCVEGKGRDLRGVIHEWAGERAAVARLLRAVGAHQRRTLLVLSPEALEAPVAGESRVGAMAMMRVLAPQRLGCDDPRELFGDADAPSKAPVYVWGLDSV